MTLSGDYEPNKWDFAARNVELYEASGGTKGNKLPGTDWPVIVVTMRGRRTGKVHKIPLMRVEHDGDYALVASLGGSPRHPVWYHNLVAAPDDVLLQDGPEPFAVTVREVSGEERARWWQRAVDAYPPYAEYQAATDRVIPVLIATPVSR